MQWIQLKDVDERNRLLEKAARLAESLGVYPELDARAEWYRHALRIAAAIRALKR